MSFLFSFNAFYTLDRMPETNFSKLELCNAEIKHSFGMCQVTGSSTENSLNSVTLKLVQTMLRPTIDCNISLKLIVNFIVFHITVTLLLCNRLRLVWMSLLKKLFLNFVQYWFTFTKRPFLNWQAAKSMGKLTMAIR